MLSPGSRWKVQELFTFVRSEPVKRKGKYFCFGRDSLSLSYGILEKLQYLNDLALTFCLSRMPLECNLFSL